MSDLLNQASLVMVPSGYKEDTVYSVVPSDGSGDLSFTRASNGTRINSAGLVEVCPWNLVTYSEQFDNAVWVKSNATVTANQTTAPNGTNTADKIEISSATNATVQQGVNSDLLVSGLPCTFTVYLKSVSGTGKVGIRSGQTGLSSLFNFTNEWQQFTWTFNSAVGTEIPQFCNSTLVSGADSAPSFYAWGAQLNIGSTAKPYFPTTDRLNVPRLTYQNGGGGCPSLLLEKQSTNLMLWSEDLAQTSWLVAQLSVTANATTSPDGTQNADKIAINNGLVGGYIYQSQSTTSSTIYTGSFFVKSAGIGFTKFWSSVSGSYCNAIINLSTGVITNGASPFPTIPTATNFGNGWWRVSYTETSGGGSVPIYVDGGSTSNGGDITGNGTDGIYLWGAQLEASSYVTSYIPTTSSSATRVEDVCNKTGVSSLIGQTEGVMFSDFNYKGNAKGSIQIYPFYIGQGTASNSVTIGLFEDALLCRVFVGGTPQNYFTSSTLSVGRHKVAFVYANNNLKLFLDGVLIQTDTSATIPTCDQIYIGASGTTVTTQLIEVNTNALWKTILTDAECIALTTI